MIPATAAVTTGSNGAAQMLCCALCMYNRIYRASCIAFAVILIAFCAYVVYLVAAH